MALPTGRTQPSNHNNLNRLTYPNPGIETQKEFSLSSNRAEQGDDLNTIAIEAGCRLAEQIIAYGKPLPDTAINRILDNAGEEFVRPCMPRGYPTAEIEAALNLLAVAFERRLKALEAALSHEGGRV